MIDRNDEPRDDEARGSFVGKNRACNVGELFKGWRRKAGLVTLAMACLLTVAWARSYCVTDRLCLFPDNHRFYSADSVDGRVVTTSGGSLSSPYCVEFRTAKRTHINNLYLGVFTLEWDWCGFGVAYAKTQNQALQLRLTPYWSLVLPLTLLSAWLILVKPRKAKTATGSTP